MEQRYKLLPKWRIYCAGRAGIKQLNDFLREKQQRDWQVRESEKEVVRLQKRIAELGETVVKWETKEAIQEPGITRLESERW
jgi:hypothetical protein